MGASPEPRIAYSTEFDPRLVEDAVLAAIEAAAIEERRTFHREREPIYEVASAAARESSFGELHNRWFVRLALGEPVHAAIEECTSITAATSRALAVPVVKAGEEFADLQENHRDHSRPILLLRIRATTLANPDRLMPWLHHELLHIADMLDPEFGFTRTLGTDDDGSVMKSLLRERYRALWDTTIDGRLESRGRLTAGQKRLRRSDFLNTFRMLGARGPAVFERFFHSQRPNHAELAAFAAQPTPAADSGATGRCPLCQMPCARLQSNPADLTARVLGLIRADFPSWEPRQSLCRQCADLYSAAG